MGQVYRHSHGDGAGKKRAPEGAQKLRRDGEEVLRLQGWNYTENQFGHDRAGAQAAAPDRAGPVSSSSDKPVLHLA